MSVWRPHAAHPSPSPPCPVKKRARDVMQCSRDHQAAHPGPAPEQPDLIHRHSGHLGAHRGSVSYCFVCSLAAVFRSTEPRNLHAATPPSNHLFQDPRMFPLPQEGLDSISVTRHVSVISITLSTVPLDARSPGYQPPLPPGMVKTHLSPVPHMGPGVVDECVPFS